MLPSARVIRVLEMRLSRGSPACDIAFSRVEGAPDPSLYTACCRVDESSGIPSFARATK